jgi:hypothetical protein
MGTTGAPTEFTMGTPEDVKGLREQLIKLLSSGLSQGATPYSGPIAPQQNQMTLGAANMLSNMMGYGPYQQSGFAMNPFTSLLGGAGGGGATYPGARGGIGGLNPSPLPGAGVTGSVYDTAETRTGSYPKEKKKVTDKGKSGSSSTGAAKKE